MPTFGLIVLLAVFSPKPEMSLKFNDITISRAISTAKLIGVKIPSPLIVMGIELKLEGRIGLLVVEVRGNVVIVKLSGVQLSNDSTKEEVLRSAVAYLNRKTGEFYVKAYMLGGVVELSGEIPK